MKNLFVSLLVLLSVSAQANSAKIKEYSNAVAKIVRAGSAIEIKVKGKDAKAVVEYIANTLDKADEPEFVHFPPEALGGDENISQYGLADLKVAIDTAQTAVWSYESTPATEKAVKNLMEGIKRYGGQFIYSGSGAVICGGTLPNLYILDLKKMVVYLIQGSSGC